ncbi:hypothetical protein BDP27DRAFT_1447781 [Rhodocollybia butyracea]|uniref:FHA domain-containing protein n=1 Tax=Rhodocollybia butyracea TaxID=206335 RepID=A0A9P5PW64_9AGAR|nr:hypothetical protein BDP27DRAFT_1447781 [Rhodocollybia butyracea]
MLRRRRSANAVAFNTVASSLLLPVPPCTTAEIAPSPLSSSAGPFHIRLVSNLESFRFDRSGNNTTPNGGMNTLVPSNWRSMFRTGSSSNAPSSSTLKFSIRDTKSSSGTFLNHVRLGPPGSASPKYEIRDGDLLQLGVDYQGGSEDIYKSVKTRVELGREWQSGVHKFNSNAIKNLESFAKAVSGPMERLRFEGCGITYITYVNLDQDVKVEMDEEDDVDIQDDLSDLGHGDESETPPVPVPARPEESAVDVDVNTEVQVQIEGGREGIDDAGIAGISLTAPHPAVTAIAKANINFSSSSKRKREHGDTLAQNADPMLIKGMVHYASADKGEYVNMRDSHGHADGGLGGVVAEDEMPVREVGEVKSGVLLSSAMQP